MILSSAAVAWAAGAHTLRFQIAPAEAADGVSVLVQNAQTGEVCTAEEDGVTFLLDAGSYAYTIRAPLYVTAMGVVDVAGDLALDIALDPVPGAELVLARLGDDHQNGTNNNPSGRDMEVEGSGYVGWIRPTAWIKHKDVNLLGGIESYTLNYARQGNDSMGFDLRLAPSGSSFEDAVSVGALSFDTPSGSWGNPGLDITRDEIAPHDGGVQDVYLVMTSGEWNFGSLTLELRPMPEEPQSYDTTFSARPYDAQVAVRSLSGELQAPTAESGKTYRLEEGFYRYTVTSPGYTARTELLIVNGARRITTVLLPEGATDYARHEAEDGELLGAQIIEDAGSSGGRKVGGFQSTNSLGALTATFSNISHVQFAVERETTGIVELRVGYSSSVSAGDQDRIAVKSNDGTAKEVYLNESGVSSVFVDMRAGQNTIYVSNVLTPRISNGGNAWIDLDYLDINTATVPGSVEPSEGDEPYIPPYNPIITSMFTADPEAHVWPEYPDKLFIYPSRDNFPSAGCNNMDAYHVFSTVNMVDFVDEGEILRRADLNDLDWITPSTNDSAFMWAPDAAYNNGWYYFYFPVVGDVNNWGATWETGVVRSRYPDRDFEQIPAEDVDANPGKPWSGFIRDSGATDGYNSMYDVSVRVYDGEAYIYNGASQTLWQGKLKDDMVTLDGELELVSTDNRSFAEAHGVPEAYNRLTNYHEGPSAFRRMGPDGEWIYYLIYPGGAGTGPNGLSGDSFYYAMADSPLGPWENAEIFFNPTGCGTSHGSIVEFNDKWYWVYHTQELSNIGEQRSVAIDEVIFNEDGTIQRFSKTSEGPGQNGPDYERPSGVIYGAGEAVPAGGAVRSADSSAGHDGQIITDLYLAGSSVEFRNVDGGEGQRAMIVFHYATPDDLPKMTLSVNGFSYKNINFVKTGGRSFFADSTFTVRRLEPGTNNTIRLETPANGGGKITLNYIEVILLEDGDAPSPDAHTVTFALTPENAEVEVRDGDDGLVSPTDDPLVYELEPGSYTYTVSAEGYRTARGDFAADADKTITVELEEGAEPEPHTVTFTLSPEEAEIAVYDSEGEPVSPTDDPLVYELEPGSYTYTVSAEGYLTQSGSFTIDGDATVTVTLVPEEEVVDAESIKITGARTVRKNRSTQLTLVVEPEGAVARGVTWEVLEEGMAEIDQNGLLTGRITGHCFVQATTEDGLIAQFIMQITP